MPYRSGASGEISAFQQLSFVDPVTEAPSTSSKHELNYNQRGAGYVSGYARRQDGTDSARQASSVPQEHPQSHFLSDEGALSHLSGTGLSRSSQQTSQGSLLDDVQDRDSTLPGPTTTPSLSSEVHSYSTYYRSRHAATQTDLQSANSTASQTAGARIHMPGNGMSSTSHLGGTTQAEGQVSAAGVDTSMVGQGSMLREAGPSGRSMNGDSASSASVAEALARAQEALNKVESSLDDIDRLPSARPETQLSKILTLARTVVVGVGLCMGLVASHAFGLAVQWASASAGGLLLAFYGYRRSSLSMSGALAAAFVGAATLGCSLRMGATLLAFFFSSSKLTQYKEELKEGLEEGSKKGGQRNWVQVFCNGGIPTILAIVYGVLAGCVDVPLGNLPTLEPWRSQLTTLIMGGFLGYYACCCGDTWASELGPLSSDTPRLITTMRPVRRGTNGGVTLLGLSASIFGGMFIGLVFYVTALASPTLWIFEQQQGLALQQWKLIPLGLMAGLVGSVLDSVLGATLQYTGYNRVTGTISSKPGPDVTYISGMPFMSNSIVNLVSAAITAALTALVALKTFVV
eukprot:CAMPEP_0202920566 /NCGR_PEP_ID=MMETSP1392-20130828/76920_1 /ASSEMBLY_ACC=CAM_ASM_000868 /TAXON_ID=225041 /ORGANISM="Chlamydomonas chlamydogama, Strain SAG 11-48b" /LENGTH=573 /DNA_ID=CAMNT_0049614069 /DNA_START=234 /DNA_END=1955 /DNA_ORIENTATION=+